MGKQTVKIVVTRLLTDEQTAHARNLGLEPVMIPALRIEFPDRTNRILRDLESGPAAAWIFTSRNAVEAFRRIARRERLPHPPRIYAVGEKTAELLGEMNRNVTVPERQDAVGLAECIIRDQEAASAGGTGIPGAAEAGESPEQAGGKRVIHWCGNRSRKELKDELGAAGIRLTRLEVYRSELNPMILPDDMGSAVLFYSPSAVEAFHRSGGFRRNLPELFAIGNTTGEALGLESGANVHIPATPSTEVLLDLVAGVLTGSGVLTGARE